MGIGDRHADNIMCTTDGRLFHIDFGHILGRFKMKAGILRERSPMVFTPQMARVMGYSVSQGGASSEAPAYRRFLELGARAFNALRRRHIYLESLFHIMLGCGLPGLGALKDIEWFINALKLDIPTEEEAAAEWREIVKSCLSTKFRQFDDSIHMFVHA
jgi:phosphatidylinositol kinase/protein kinase (PI-3  family)